MLRKVILNLALILTLIPVCLAQDVTFNKTRYSSLKQPRETGVVLLVSDSQLSIKSLKETKKMEPINLTIPYSTIDSMTYESASRHRTQEGSALMGLSLAGGAILMSTKTKSYWLLIAYHEGDLKQSTMLRLDKSEYNDVISTLEKKTGKEIPNLDSKTSPGLLNPTVGSKDMDEVVPFGIDAVVAALKPAMASVGCKVKDESANRIQCKRALGFSERTGNGGEKVTATMEAKGDRTHVRIWTGKKFVDEIRKDNWSTMIYQEMMNSLQKTAQSHVASQAN
jgi:hypothetical protein